MNRTNKLRQIAKALSPNKVDFSVFDAELSKLKKGLEETVYIQTADDVSRKLKQFQSKIDFEPLMKAVESIRNSFTQKTKELEAQIDSKVLEVIGEKDLAIASTINAEIESLKEELVKIKSSELLDVETLTKQIKDAKSASERIDTTIRNLVEEVNTKSTKEEAKGISESLEKMRTELLTHMSRLGGGSANRQFFVGGADPLTKYTDINFKAGSNVTLTYANNNTTKKVDITIASTGGGGGGTVRSINSIAVDTSAGDASGTDYVYLCGATLTLTLPTSVANTNLYTVKNTGAGTITIVTTGGETIDGGANLIMPVQFTSVDLISNNSGDWAIT